MREHKYIYTLRTNVSLEDTQDLNTHIFRV